jgi:hypothetical protein
MFYRTVAITFTLDEMDITTHVDVGCVPETPDEELICWAKKIFMQSIESATYHV